VNPVIAIRCCALWTLFSRRLYNKRTINVTDTKATITAATIPPISAAVRVGGGDVGTM